MSKHYWWCGWEVPNALPQDDFVDKWPDNMRGWRTGCGTRSDTWAGVVIADDAEAAWQAVLSCFGSGSEHIDKRWEPTLRAYTIAEDRFPGLAAFMAQQKAIAGDAPPA